MKPKPIAFLSLPEQQLLLIISCPPQLQPSALEARSPHPSAHSGHLFLHLSPPLPVTKQHRVSPGLMGQHEFWRFSLFTPALLLSFFLSSISPFRPFALAACIGCIRRYYPEGLVAPCSHPDGRTAGRRRGRHTRGNTTETPMRDDGKEGRNLFFKMYSFFCLRQAIILHLELTKQAPALKSHAMLYSLHNSGVYHFLRPIRFCDHLSRSSIWSCVRAHVLQLIWHTNRSISLTLRPHEVAKIGNFGKT